MVPYYKHKIKRKFLSLNEINKLKIFLNKTYSEKTNTNYENVISINLDFFGFKGLLHPLINKIEDHFFHMFDKNEFSLQKVWLVNTVASDCDPNSLPFVPHFDKQRLLKVMLYLNDVTKKHGPIHFGSLLDPNNIDKRRMSLPKNYKELGLNLIDKKQLISKMVPILGKAGDAIFFDTNSAHAAGVVQGNNSRKVLRFDFDVKGFNPKPSIIKKFTQKVFS